MDFRLIVDAELEIAVKFAHQTLGAPTEWLTGYFSERIMGNELFGLWLNGQLIATGECRPSASQKLFADVGMIVSKDHRKQGLATNILRALRHHCNSLSLSAICSTEADNIPAQKAILKAGFISYDRILEINF